MVDLIAKRYVKALIEQRETEEIKTICGELKIISTAYASQKFMMILESSDIEIAKKVDLILSFVNHYLSNASFNLIKLLAEKKRLNLIPSIVKELELTLSKMTNTYTGVVYTNTPLSDLDLMSINSQFATKFNVNLSLRQNICDYDGIKVDIEDLGCEISFSKDRLRSQMIEHILKAV
ncbi:MAG: F0F1 ATP synthase subunit delta [Campylobacterales bacterium]|nr:F0F1 ATP synthase subunit delta [Campylobacterales bacterium]